MKEIFGDDDCEEMEDEVRGNAETDDNSIWNRMSILLAHLAKTVNRAFLIAAVIGNLYHI